MDMTCLPPARPGTDGVGGRQHSAPPAAASLPEDDSEPAQGPFSPAVRIPTSGICKRGRQRGSSRRGASGVLQMGLGWLRGLSVLGHFRPALSHTPTPAPLQPRAGQWEEHAATAADFKILSTPEQNTTKAHIPETDRTNTPRLGWPQKGPELGAALSGPRRRSRGRVGTEGAAPATLSRLGRGGRRHGGHRSRTGGSLGQQVGGPYLGGNEMPSSQSVLKHREPPLSNSKS